jgi:hypothetical protein
MRMDFRLTLVALCTLSLQCSSSDSSSASLSMSGGAPGGTAPQGLAACAWSADPCPIEVSWQAKPLLQAAEIAADARFVGLGGQVVAVQSGSGPRVVRVHTADEAKLLGSPYKIYRMPGSVQRLVDVADGAGSVLALACTAAGSCSLWRASVDAPADSLLEEIAGSTLAVPAKALIFDVVTAQPCAIGPALQCFAGGWQTLIEPGAGVEIRDVATGSDLSLAVGTRGHYWTRGSAPAPWIAARTVDVSLFAASLGGSVGVAIGEAGIWFYLEGKEPELCATPANWARSLPARRVTPIPSSRRPAKSFTRTPARDA